jgi:hypothetical protein
VEQCPPIWLSAEGGARLRKPEQGNLSRAGSWQAEARFGRAVDVSCIRCGRISLIRIAKRLKSSGIMGRKRRVDEEAKPFTPQAIWCAGQQVVGESGGIATDNVKPETGGACKCWASPGHGRGWSIIQKVNRVSVTVLDNWGNGGKNFTRTIPFDKLRAVICKAEVDAKRAAGVLTDSANGLGFFLAEVPPERPARQTDPDGQAEKFDALAEQLREGVKVVSVPTLFPTPPEIARRVVELADIRPGQRVLEPSAGTGSLLDALPEGGYAIVAMEINGQLAEALQRRVTGVVVRCDDFLTLNGELGEFDRAIMNPPFSMDSISSTSGTPTPS